MPLKPENIRTAADARNIVEERGLTHVKVGVFDADGVLRGKYISKAKFFSALESGFGFCDVVFGWDSNDQLYDNVTFTGWHTAYPDAFVRVLPETCRALPFEENTLLFLCEFTDKAEAICPRGTLRRVLDRAAKMGFDVNARLRVRILHVQRDAGERCARRAIARTSRRSRRASSAIPACAAPSGPSSITRSWIASRPCASPSRGFIRRPGRACWRPHSITTSRWRRRTGRRCSRLL